MNKPKDTKATVRMDEEELVQFKLKTIAKKTTIQKVLYKKVKEYISK